MFIFNKHTNSWSNWIGKFGQDLVLVNLSIDSDNVITWEKRVSECRISIRCHNHFDPSEGPFTSLPNVVLDNMRKHLGTPLSEFLINFQMRSIDYSELKREEAAATGIRLGDLTNIKRHLMLPRPNASDKLTQEYYAIGFED
jgi:hypothetical protein